MAKLNSGEKGTRKDVSAQTLAAVTAAAAAGESRRDILKRFPDCPERLVRALQQSGVSADEFEQLLSVELRSLLTETTLEIRKALREGKFAAGSLPILLGIVHDKLSSREGRNGLRSASVNVTVNNFNGSTSKAAILDALAGNPTPALLANSGDGLESIEAVAECIPVATTP